MFEHHTPGPWQYWEDSGVPGRYVVDTQDGGHWVARYVWSEANAALIAAAPDLLAACEAYIETNERAKQEYWSGYYDEIRERLADIRTAVAKAKGAPPDA